jgi:hypothetical protein
MAERPDSAVSGEYADRLKWRRLSTALLLAATCLVGIALAAYIYNGYFVRYLADDYCVEANVDRLGGLWDAQKFWYEAWAGRYSHAFVTDVMAKIGEGGACFYVPFLLCVWFAAIGWAYYQIGRLAFGRGLLLPSVLVAATILFAFLRLLPNRHETVYWLNAAANYVLPLVFATFNAGLIAKGLADRRNVLPLAVISFVLCFLAAGFAETFTFWHAAALFLVLQLAARFLTGELLKPAVALVGAGLLGTLLGAWVVIRAPGNDNRQRTIGDTLPLPETAWQSAVDGLSFFAELLLHPEVWLTFLTVAAVSWFVAAQFPRPEAPELRRVVPRLGMGLTVTYVLVAATHAPGYYFLDGLTPDRALASAVFSVVLFAAYAGHEAGSLFAFRVSTEAIHIPRAGPLTAAAVALALFAAVVIPAAAREFARSDELSAYAAAWDERHLLLQAAPAEPEVRVPFIAHDSGLELNPNPSFWMNSCAASYYGMPGARIVAEPD